MQPGDALQRCATAMRARIVNGANVFKAAMLLLPLCACGAAQAQWSGRIALVSDYILRGVSLSDGKSAPQASLQYEGRNGWYAGAFASRVALDPDAAGMQFAAYTGLSLPWTTRMPRGVQASWDAGLMFAAFPGQVRYNYASVYAGVHAGLASNDVSMRLHYSPDYFGQGASSLYAEANAAHALADRVQVFAHLGRQRQSSALQAAPAWDARIGLTLAAGDWSLELAANRAGAIRADYTPYSYGRSQAFYGTEARRFVLSVTRSF
ncbi:TorF family putative porin [Noviherbaspirillum galbum]|uniref:Uncharacterized protein n=1 Tax=Noviherbaspirillum galbum TaxID=2709383 RepID=A0A6B3SW30_9BURK|nr:TorF family putative porin [Noviherbaspirillum galbum]NEX64758.1 hypothetical protein [Noviherbaspirillum galbum]